MLNRALRSSVLPCAAAAIVLGGCSGEGGSPAPAPTTVASSSPASSSQSAGKPNDGGLSGVIACELLNKSELSQLGVSAPGTDAGVRGGTGTSGCDWQRPTSSDSEGFALGITVRPAQGIDSVVLQDGWSKTPGEFGADKRSAVLLERTKGGGGACMIALAVGQEARVDINTAAGGNTELACSTANDVAKLIEPKLPKDGG